GASPFDAAGRPADVPVAGPAGAAERLAPARGGHLGPGPAGGPGRRAAEHQRQLPRLHPHARRPDPRRLRHALLAASVRRPARPGPGEIAMTTLSLVLPAYNEAAGIAHAVREAVQALPRLAAAWEVIVVDDGSSDGTEEVARGAVPGEERVRVLRHPEN